MIGLYVSLVQITNGWCWHSRANGVEGVALGLPIRQSVRTRRYYRGEAVQILWCEPLSGGRVTADLEFDPLFCKTRSPVDNVFVLSIILPALLQRFPLLEPVE